MDPTESYLVDLAAISRRRVSVPAGEFCGDVQAAFALEETGGCIAVVDDDQAPIGVVSKNAFLRRLADPIGNEVFGARPIVQLMDRDFLQIERRTTLDDLDDALADGGAGDVDGYFIVTERGRYAGVGRMADLLRIMADHLRTQRLEADAAKRDAEIAMNSKSRFLANMTHELRTPLNGVIGFGQLLASEAHGPLGASEYRDYARDIVASGEHLIAIISDILDLAKMEAGRVNLHERFVDLRDLAGRYLRMVTPLAAQKNIRLHTDNGDKPWMVRADERRLQQAIINLLSNAIKFTPRDGDVGISIGVNHGWAWIEVWDAGVGIKEADLERLFKPFEQLENGDSRAHEGTGLGLTITKTLMQAHGGDVEFKSKLGEGTRVKLLLPRTRLLADKFSWSVQSRVEFIDPPEEEAV